MVLVNDEWAQKFRTNKIRFFLIMLGVSTITKKDVWVMFKHRFFEDKNLLLLLSLVTIPVWIPSSSSASTVLMLCR
jgi:hypothetical protein